MLLKRRSFLKLAGLLTASTIMSACQTEAKHFALETLPWRMPDEAERHKQTWMAFGASAAIWGEELLPIVQHNLAEVALAIAQFEPVSMLVREAEWKQAQALLGSEVELVPAALDDFWIRDTGPVFVKNTAGEMAGIDFNFNGWGERQAYAQDALVAERVLEYAGTPTLNTRLILEGGALEVDGQGTAIITESCVLNSNRNPGLSKAECEAELKRLLGLTKIIWLPGIAGKDITDGHTDFYARFAGPGKVVASFDPHPDSFDNAVTQRHLEILQQETDAAGRALKVVTLTAPTTVRPAYATLEDFAAGYLNFYVCNGGLILPEFGDAPADQAAQDTLGELFPEHELVPVNIDGIAAGGGGIHCATQQEPA